MTPSLIPLDFLASSSLSLFIFYFFLLFFLVFISLSSDTNLAVQDGNQPASHRQQRQCYQSSRGFYFCHGNLRMSILLTLRPLPTYNYGLQH